jgi:hypothetical protein
MNEIESILRSHLKPKEIQAALVDGVCAGRIGAGDFVDFFLSAPDGDKGTCADVMKHVSEQHPELLEPYIDCLIEYINYKAPRVKWGIPEAMGYLAKKYPDRVAAAIPYLLENTVENKVNTTVIRWCAAFAISEIVKYNPHIQRDFVPKMKELSEKEKNNGVRNVYVKALKTIEKSIS